MTLKQLRDACEKQNHGLIGYYNSGELYVNRLDGSTVYQRQMEWRAAEELCEELGLTLTEI